MKPTLTRKRFKSNSWAPPSHLAISGCIKYMYMYSWAPHSHLVISGSIKYIYMYSWAPHSRLVISGSIKYMYMYSWAPHSHLVISGSITYVYMYSCCNFHDCYFKALWLLRAIFLLKQSQSVWMNLMKNLRVQIWSGENSKCSHVLAELGQARHSKGVRSVQISILDTGY